MPNAMQPIIDYILRNKEWIFSGIGVVALSGMIWFIRLLLFSNSPHINGEFGNHTTVNLAHHERLKREPQYQAQGSVDNHINIGQSTSYIVKLLLSLLYWAFLGLYSSNFFIPARASVNGT